MKIRASLLLALALSFIAVNTQALVIRAHTDVTGAQEVPEVMTEASGVAYLDFLPERNVFNFMLIVTGIFIDDIDFGAGPLAFGGVGPVHLHDGYPGENGPVIIPFADRAYYTSSHTGFRLDARRATAPDNLAELLTSGRLYVNVHTLDNPGGEIRGQLVAASVAEPGSLALLGFGALGLMLARRKAAKA